MEENRHLLHPLLNPSTSNTTTTPTRPSSSTATTTPLDDQKFNNLKLISSNSGIISRLSLLAFIGIVSIWANHEASKGYAISIVNESRDTIEGKRFQLFYVSNDEATRILIKASTIVENVLYPDMESYTKKPINHMILNFTSQNISNSVIIDSRLDHEFVLNINHSIIKGTNFSHTILKALQQGVARIWLWDGQGNAPKNLIDGVVEYIMSSNLSGLAGGSRHDRVDPPRLATACWKHDDSRGVAQFLDYCERQHPGFIRRLNQAMKDEWHDGILDDALGQPVQNLCTPYQSLMYNFSSV